MKRAGTVFFWIAWPFWFFYFRVASRRSRVLVVSDGKLLFVKGWLGRNEWGLPGGGAKRGEAIELSAVRELKEETGMDCLAGQLEYLGKNTHKEAGLKYDAVYFLLKLDEKPELKIQKNEIAEAGWFSADEAKTIKLNKDAQFALTEYGVKI